MSIEVFGNDHKPSLMAQLIKAQILVAASVSCSLESFGITAWIGR
jgi:hypothetical protein